MSNSPVAHLVKRDAATIIGERDGDFIALLTYGQRYFANFRFAATLADQLGFDAMRQRVTHQVLQHRRQALQHATVHLDSSATNIQVGAFLQVFRSLPQGAIESIRNVGEWHCTQRLQAQLYRT